MKVFFIKLPNGFLYRDVKSRSRCGDHCVMMLDVSTTLFEAMEAVLEYFASDDLDPDMFPSLVTGEPTWFDHIDGVTNENIEQFNKEIEKLGISIVGAEI